MDITQIILVVAIAVLTAILTLVGFEVFLIFKEFHRVMQKFNQIMDDARMISGSVSKQVTNVSELIGTVKTTFDLAKGFFQKEEKLSLPEGPGNGHSAEEKPTITASVRRFFTRAGKRLS